MKIKMEVMLIMIVWLLGCENQSTSNSKIYSAKNDFKGVNLNVLNDSVELKGIDIGYNNLKLKGKLERKTKVVSRKEQLNTGCLNWTFNESSLEGLLKKMKKVEAVQWNMLCYEYPCYYEGKVSNGKSEFNILINGASFIKVYNKTETSIFIYTVETPIFLTPCNCCE